MIRLITGTPGAGKTLFAVAEILPTFAGRTIYADGIPGLTIDHQLPLGEVETWHEWLPEGAVLVVDECQRIWRPRAASARVPDGVAAMETHRHNGHDLVLITQHPNLLDMNVRRLVGAHQHVRRIWGLARAVVYEWDSATDPGRISTATKRVWAYPRRAFSQYQSASQHNSRGQRPPWLIFAVPLVLLGVGYAIHTAYQSIKSRYEPSVPVQSSASLPTAQAQTLIAPITDPLAWELPRDPLRPETAPVFDGLRQPVTIPTIAACISTATRCQCYTHQATPLPTPADECREIALRGRFDPYQQPAPIQAHQAQPSAPAQLAQDAQEQLSPPGLVPL